MTRVSKSAVPEISGGGGEHGGRWCTTWGAGKRVEIPFTVAAKDHTTSLQVLHRKTKSVKLNRTKIISSKFADRQKISNQVRNKKDMIEFKNMTGGRLKRSITRRRNRDRSAVFYSDELWTREWGRKSMLPSSFVMWEVAPESITQPPCW